MFFQSDHYLDCNNLSSKLKLGQRWETDHLVKLKIKLSSFNTTISILQYMCLYLPLLCYKTNMCYLLQNFLFLSLCVYEKCKSNLSISTEYSIYCKALVKPACPNLQSNKILFVDCLFGTGQTWALFSALLSKIMNMRTLLNFQSFSFRVCKLETATTV